MELERKMNIAPEHDENVESDYYGLQRKYD
jgi:hypothetical protein